MPCEREVVEEEEMVRESDDEVEVKHDTKKDIIKAESDEDSDSDSSDEEMDEDAIQRRRDLMRQKAQLKAQAGMTAQEILAKEEEKRRAWLAHYLETGDWAGAQWMSVSPEELDDIEERRVAAVEAARAAAEKEAAASEMSYDESQEAARQAQPTLPLLCLYSAPETHYF